MTTTRRVRAALDINRRDIPEVLARAQTIHDGLDADPATYVAPNPSLPELQILIDNLATAQGAVARRTTGAAATRDVERDLLMTALESERMYVQALSDQDRVRSVALIQNAGLVVAEVPSYAKAALVLRCGAQSGIVTCDANVSLLVSAGARPRQSRFFNWEYTVDGGKTFITAPSTSTGKTTIQGLVPLTVVGVRVNLNNAEGPGAWSQVVSMLVR